MNITKKFLELTSRTYPHGTERELFHLLNKDLKEDEFGNLFIKIGESDAMFTSHLDTATKALCEVNHIFEKNIIKTDGKSILGADDKAGVTIMLYMIEHNVPGLYYFFLGEEVGCIGSKKVAGVQKVEKIPGINKVISFDRRGTDSIITFQSSKRSCSDKFGQALADELNLINKTFDYKLDKNGILTDSIQFTSIYPECTNISVGYYSEHTFSERQDIEHLRKLAVACLTINWNELPVDRDPSKVEYDDWYGAKSYGWGSCWDDEYYDSRYNTGNYSGKKENIAALANYQAKNIDGYYLPSIEKTYAYGSREKQPTTPVPLRNYVYDKPFNYVSYIDVSFTTNKIVKVDLHEKRVKYEQRKIESLLTSLEVHYSRIEWDGFTLNVFYTTKNGGHKTKCDRNDIVEYLPELDFKDLDTLEDYDAYLEIELLGY
jgi:hypothetical protein